jgi:hypothetical protein
MSVTNVNLPYLLTLPRTSRRFSSLILKIQPLYWYEYFHLSRQWYFRIPHHSCTTLRCFLLYFSLFSKFHSSTYLSVPSQLNTLMLLAHTCAVQFWRFISRMCETRYWLHVPLASTNGRFRTSPLKVYVHLVRADFRRELTIFSESYIFFTS